MSEQSDRRDVLKSLGWDDRLTDSVTNAPQLPFKFKPVHTARVAATVTIGSVHVVGGAQPSFNFSTQAPVKVRAT